MQTGEIIQGTVTDIKKTHFIIKLANNSTGLVHISEVSDYYVAKIENLFKVGETHTFKVLAIGPNHKIKLSWKSLKPRFQKDPFNFTLEATEHGFTKLLKNTNKEIEND